MKFSPSHFVTLSLLAIPLSGFAEPSTGQQMLQLIENKCASCHTGTAKESRKYGDFRDHKNLIKLVDLKNPKQSVLYLKLKSGAMPEADFGDVIDDRELPGVLDLVVKWIKEGGPELQAQAPTVVANKYSKAQEVDAALKALKNESDPANIRFISFANIQNDAVRKHQLDIFKKGVSKLINSLSNERKITLPKSVDANNLVYMINLKDYSWKPETWRALENRYSYKGEYLTQFDRFGELRDTTKSKVPMIRGDWFLKEASQPPLYHELLDMPTTDRDLETQLRVDVNDNIRRSNVLRAGFVSSGVSQNNRMLERHDSRFGAYWKSYDFSSSLGNKNIIINPLGPANLETDFPENAFQHDGGEIIYSLPNGLQAYMLVDSAGRRIDKGPINIVSDPNRPDRLVTNGLSCMNCHNAGIIQKADDVARSLKFTNRFKAGAVKKIENMYSSAIHAKMDEDSKRFMKALTGANALLQNNEDAINKGVQMYEALMNQEQVRNELGLTEDLLKKLKAEDANSPALKAYEQAAVGMKRDLFESLFFKVNSDINKLLRQQAGNQ